MLAPDKTVAVLLLFAGFGSVVIELTLAVFEMVVPTGVPWSVVKLNWNVADAPLANEAIVQLIVPVPPAGGVVQVNAGPLVCEAEAKCVFAGTTSVSVTLIAGDGPAFATVTVQVAGPPEGAMGGAFLVTERSAFAATVVIAVDVLLPGAGSDVLVATVAVLLIVVPFGVAAGTFTTIEKVADAPAVSDAIEQLIVAPVVQVNAGPVVWFSDTNVVPAGRMSFITTLAAVDGPMFPTAIV